MFFYVFIFILFAIFFIFIYRYLYYLYYMLIICSDKMDQCYNSILVSYECMDGFFEFADDIDPICGRQRKIIAELIHGLDKNCHNYYI